MFDVGVLLSCRPHIGYGGSTGKALFERYGWTVTEGNDWDLLWAFMPQYNSIHETFTNSTSSGFTETSSNHLIYPWQRHNHCFLLDKAYGMQGTKQSQWDCFVKMRRRFGQAQFNYMPESYDLPRDFALLQSHINSVGDAKGTDR